MQFKSKSDAEQAARIVAQESGNRTLICYDNVTGKWAVQQFAPQIKTRAQAVRAAELRSKVPSQVQEFQVID